MKSTTVDHDMLNTSELGFTGLPNQIHRKVTKKGFKYTILILGERGLGKRSFINSIYSKPIYPDTKKMSLSERCDAKINIVSKSVDFIEKSMKLNLSIVVADGFGDSLDENIDDRNEPIVCYINEKFDEYFKGETGINRRNLVDDRVHACVYFINPISNKMKSSDIVTLLKLHKIVNVIPVIARSDLLNVQELAQMKWNILKQINDNNIEIYTLGDEGGEEDESGEYLEELNKLNRLIPFAVVGATDCSEGSGSKLRGRKYPWGFINIEDKDHCNFSALRAILTTYIADLKEVTENYLYEVYRCSKLRQAINVSKRQSRFTVDNNLK